MEQSVSQICSGYGSDCYCGLAGQNHFGKASQTIDQENQHQNR